MHQRLVEVSGKKRRREETKTSVKRWFSCPERLQALLEEIRPNAPSHLSALFTLVSHLTKTWLSERTDCTVLTPKSTRDEVIPKHAYFTFNKITRR